MRGSLTLRVSRHIVKMVIKRRGLYAYDFADGPCLCTGGAIPTDQLGGNLQNLITNIQNCHLSNPAYFASYGKNDSHRQANQLSFALMQARPSSYQMVPTTFYVMG